MHEKKLFLLDTTKESRRKRNQSVCWLKEGHKLEDLRTMLDVLCDNDIPGSVWFTFIRAGIGQQRASDQLQQSLTLLNKKSIQLPGFTFPNKSPLWVSSMGYQAHSNIKYFNCHISLSSLSLFFFFLHPWKPLWQLHAVYLCESRLQPTWECLSWCTELPLHCSCNSRGTHPSAIKPEGAGEGLAHKLHSYQHSLGPYCMARRCYKPPALFTAERWSLKKWSFLWYPPKYPLLFLLENGVSEDEQ